MSDLLRCLQGCAVFGLAVGLLAGCGSSASPEPKAETATKTTTPPTAAIPAAEADDDADDFGPDGAAEPAIEAPKEGTPDWCVREAVRLKLEPPPKTEDVEQLRTFRRERNQKIISLCEQAIAKVHENKEQVRLFNLAVRNLLDARLQLAMGGAAEDIDALYTDALALIEREPQSETAAEASFTLVNLAYSLARHTAVGDTEWIKEFARQASYFATNYPREEPRSVPLLFTAARSCELNNLDTEAADCFALLVKSFPKNQYAPRATTILRRLRLPGNSVQIAGPTLGGEPFALDDLLGKPVLVVFWSTEAKPFEEQLPTLRSALKTHANTGIQVVGINLDTDTGVVTEFLKANRITWPQIVFDDADQRGWNHPVANFYGVMEIPAYWLIDPNGAVVSTNLTAETLEPAIANLVNGKPAAQSAQTPSGSRTK